MCRKVAIHCELQEDHIKNIMQKNKFNTFLFTNKSESRIYINRIELPKKLIYTTVASLILTVGVSILGVAGYFSGTNLSEVETAVLQKTPVKTIKRSAGYQPISYDRPEESNEIINNTGGPFFEYKLSNESEDEETNIEESLKKIEATSNPAFLPTIWAHLGKINNEFGFRRNPFGGRSYEFHAGMDIDGESGDIVVAPANGIVINAGWTGGYGNMIEIDHGNGLTTRYGHLSKIEVADGDLITRGQLIGLIGSTGRSTGPHLHYELRVNDKQINPRRFLPPAPPEFQGQKDQ